jgi:hypothetical protein
MPVRDYNSRMRRIAALALVGAALLAGCAPMQWMKADATPEQALADEGDCFQASLREAQARNWYYPSMVGPVVTPSAAGGGGLMMWPSGSMVDPYGYQMLEQQRLAQFCMEARGYKLAPAAKK